MAKPVRLTLYVDNDQLKRAFRESGDSADKFAKHVDDTGSKVKASTIAIGAAMGTLAVDFAAKLVGMAADAAQWVPKLGEEFDNVFDKIRVNIGNNTVLNGQLEDTFRTVFSNVSSGMQDTGDAVYFLYNRLGITGPQLQSLATDVLNLARITGTDLQANLESITTAFNVFNVPAGEMGDKLNFLFRASQEAAVPLDQLASDVQANAAELQNLGFSFEDATLAAAGLGKAGVSLSDLSQGFKRTFINAVKDGKPANEFFQDYIKGIEDGSIDGAQAIADLGTRAGVDFYALARNGKLNFDKLNEAIMSSTDTIDQATQDTNDWPEKWQNTWNKIELAVEPAADRVFALFGQALDDMIVLDDKGNIVGLDLARAWDDVSAAWDEAWANDIKPWLDDVGNKIQTWWDNGGSTSVGNTAKNIGKWLGEQLFNALKEALLAGLSSLPDALRNGLSALYGNEQQTNGQGGIYDPTDKNSPMYDSHHDPNSPNYDPNDATVVPGRALGGPVRAGMPYMVGEHRRELFVPKVDGKIVPSTGGMGDTNYFTIVNPDPRGAALEVIRQRRAVAFLAGGR